MAALILALTVASAAASDGPSLNSAYLPESANPTFVDGDGRPAIMPSPAIILFYANWCAPCRVEIRSIDDLARAASPVPVIVVPWDAEARTRQALRNVAPAYLRYATGGAYRLMVKLAGPSGGLPVAVALDTEGKPCNIRRQALEASTVKAFLNRCR